MKAHIPMMKKLITYCLTLSMVLLCPAGADALEVRVRGDKFSIHAESVPLQDILRQLAGTGVKVRIDPELNPEVSADFEARDLQKGLSAILRPLDHVLVWDAVEKQEGRSFRLAEIQVFRPGYRKLMQLLRKSSGRKLNIAKNPKDGTLYVRDEILLKLAPGAKASQLAKLLRKIRGTVVERNPGLGLYRISVPKNSNLEAITELIAKNSRIAKAEPNYAYPIGVPSDFSQYDFDDADIAKPPDGAVPIAVLDTGLASFGGLDEVVLASLDALNPDAPISDTQGHGTQMALIAAGLVKPYGVTDGTETNNPVIPIRSFDENGFTSNFGIMQSIDFALKNGAKVMSLSWGSETRSEFMEDAFDYADSKGMIVVGAAGNKPTGKPFYPAAYDSVLGVGALNPEGKQWKNSNYGSFVSLSAPGFATLPVGYKGDPGTYAGTSISTAFVANRIANYLSENPGATKQNVSDALGKMF